MTGVLFAFIAALSWAGSSTILKVLSIRVDPLSLNSFRLWVGSFCLAAFLFLSGRGGELLRVPIESLVFVIGSGIIGLAIGDTIYIKSLSLFDVSRAYAIAICSFPVFTLFLAILWLGERITWLTGAGAFLVLCGIYMVAVVGKRRGPNHTEVKTAPKGALLALLSGLVWAISAAILKKGVIGMDPFLAASVRITAAAVALLFILYGMRKKRENLPAVFDAKNAALAAAAGVLTYGVAAVAFILAIQLLGAGRAVLVTSTSPILLLPFSVFMLRESVTRNALVGILLCVAGVYFVIV